MKKVEFWIDQCMDCTFLDHDSDNDYFCRETTIGRKKIKYPDKAGWFPEWCPLESEKVRS